MSTSKPPKFLRSVDKKSGPWKAKTKSRKKPTSPAKLRKKTPKHLLEDSVKKEIITRSREINHEVWRQHCGLVRVGPHYMKLAPSGAADLTGIMRCGKRLEVEVKRRDGKGRQSADQKKWQQFIEEHNGLYVVVKNCKEFEKFIEKHLTTCEICSKLDL